jgi:hypothetical protein
MVITVFIYVCCGKDYLDWLSIARGLQVMSAGASSLASGG